MRIKVMLDEGAVLPKRAHDTDAGYDLYSRKSALVGSGESCFFDTGVHMLIPKGYAGFIKAKSGLNRNEDITCTGVVDAGYTGSIGVNLQNVNIYRDVHICEGQKIAQIVILPVVDAELDVVDSLGETERGNGGFGSTGKF